MPPSEVPESPLQYCNQVLTREIPGAVRYVAEIIQRNGSPKALQGAGKLSEIITTKFTNPWLHKLQELLQATQGNRIGQLKGPLMKAKEDAKAETAIPAETAPLRASLAAGSEVDVTQQIGLALRQFEIQIVFWEKARTILAALPAGGDVDADFAIAPVADDEPQLDVQVRTPPETAMDPSTPPASIIKEPVVSTQSAAEPKGDTTLISSSSGPSRRQPMPGSKAAAYMARVREAEQAEKKENWLKRKLRGWGLLGKKDAKGKGGRKKK